MCGRRDGGGGGGTKEEGVHHLLPDSTVVSTAGFLMSPQHLSSAEPSLKVANEEAELGLEPDPLASLSLL